MGTLTAQMLRKKRGDDLIAHYNGTLNPDGAGIGDLLADLMMAFPNLDWIEELTMAETRKEG